MSALKYYDGTSWVTVGATAGGALASVQGVRIVQTAGSNSGTGVMAAVGFVLTPTATGKVLVTFCGGMQSLGPASAQINALVRYGTGAAPVHGAAPVGTATTPSAYGSVAAANQILPFSVTAIITGLTVGTAYWFDLMYSNNGGVDTFKLWTVSGNGVELA